MPGGTGNAVLDPLSQTGACGSVIQFGGAVSSSRGVMPDPGAAVATARHPGAAATAPVVSSAVVVCEDRLSSNTVPAGATSWGTTDSARIVPRAWLSRSTICDAGALRGKSCRPNGPRRRVSRRSAGATAPEGMRLAASCADSVAVVVPSVRRTRASSALVICRKLPALASTVRCCARVDCPTIRANWNCRSR